MITRAVNRSRLFVAFLIAIVVSGSNLASSFAALPLPAPVCSGSTCTITLTSTSDYYQWAVPSGVTRVSVIAIGGSGGAGFWQTARPPGGFGAKLTETITVTAGDQLYFYVGGAGGNAASGVASSAGLNAAGSSGGPGVFSGVISGGGGGAASEIRLNGTAVNNRIIVAAGGGGGGAGCGATSSTDQNNDAGGNASGNTGGNGLCVGYAATNGGSGGKLTSDGNNGTSRIGRTASFTGGGGGGGYYGGGAGNQGGGGAGSSWIDTATVQGTYASSAVIGTGSISFSYPYTPPAITSLDLNTGIQISFRTQAQLTAYANTDGYITFLANGKRIPGCIKVKTTSQSATCSYKPSTRGAIQVSALLYLQRTDTSTATSSAVNTTGSSKTSRR